MLVSKIPFVKRIPKHDPTSSYYHLVSCIAECMLIPDEYNQHVHGGYSEETTPSLNVNDTDKDESKEIIVHKPVSENLSMDVSESDCDIVNETLSQNNLSDVPTNVITKFKYDEHIEPSVSDKGSSYFNIFECGRNILDQLDVTYKHAFTTSSATSTVSKRFYQISPAREIYYDIMADHIEEKNVGTIDKEDLCKAITHVKSEDEAEHERNIDNMTQVDDYKQPWKNKDATDATTINNALDDTGYTFLNSY